MTIHNDDFGDFGFSRKKKFKKAKTVVGSGRRGRRTRAAVTSTVRTLPIPSAGSTGSRLFLPPPPRPLAPTASLKCSPGLKLIYAGTRSERCVPVEVAPVPLATQAAMAVAIKQAMPQVAVPAPAPSTPAASPPLATKAANAIAVKQVAKAVEAEAEDKAAEAPAVDEPAATEEVKIASKSGFVAPAAAAAAGFVVGGPIGALLGGAAGWYMGRKKTQPE